MRISDWSSDVCSSDLRLKEPYNGATVVITHHAPSLRSLQDNPHVGGHMDAAYANRWEHRMGSDRANLWVQDRKSVVSGKRVSVRVDIGGRSIIKKKNIPQNMSLRTYI